jgi:hypothetical protein
MQDVIGSRYSFANHKGIMFLFYLYVVNLEILLIQWSKRVSKQAHSIK